MGQTLLEQKDLFLSKGEWDGAFYILWCDNALNGVLKGNCTDILGAYYDRDNDSVELRCADREDKNTDWISPESLSPEVYNKVVSNIKKVNGYEN